jgi:indole-3-glycerol phosphate synthase
MLDFLADMAAASAARSAEARNQTPERTLRERIDTVPPPTPLPRGFLLIAEIKRISPAAGQLAPSNTDIIARARDYTTGGASALSILTEPTRFGGSLEDLRAVASAVPTPIMRKDFLVDVYQILEARAHGASGILLIVKMLSDEALRTMLAAAADLNMFTLIEAFDEEDLARATELLPAKPSVLLGINTRDLRTLAVDSTRLESLSAHRPPNTPFIAESGIETPADITRITRLGYTGALVGTALMRSSNPAQLCRDMHAAALVSLACPATRSLR